MRWLASIMLLVSVAVMAQDMVTPLRADVVEARRSEFSLPEADHRTGALNFDIPIYTIDVDGFQLPLKLNYHTNGVKVFDDAGTIGYGWTLQPQLMITRTVLGRPDESFDNRANDLRDCDSTQLSDWAYYCMSNSSKTPSSKKCDYLPDIFQISLPERTLTRVGKKNKDGSLELVGAGDDEYKIECSNTCDVIEVTDPHGVKYIFKDYYELSVEHVYSNHVKTTWGIKQIVLPSGRTIDFEWRDFVKNGIMYEGGTAFVDMAWIKGEYTTIKYANDAVKENIEALKGQFNRLDNGILNNISLKSISFPSGGITLSYDNNFLKEIKITPKGNYVKGSKTIKIKSSDAGLDGKLVDSIEIPEKGIYSFDYKREIYNQMLNDAANQYNDIYSQDWWGYYNGKQNKTLTPSIYFTKRDFKGDVSEYFNFKAADRNVVVDNMDVNIIQEIRYPNGATTFIEYEPHKWDDVEGNEVYEDILIHPVLLIGGGLRVKSLQTHFFRGNLPSIKKTYQYEKTQIATLPTLNTYFNVDSGYTSYPDERLKYPIFGRVVQILPQSDYMRYNFNTLPIWYNMVTEYFSEGKKIYYYTDDCLEKNIIDTNTFGVRILKHLGMLFNNGPVIEKVETYSNLDNGYALVEEDLFDYSKENKNVWELSFLRRHFIQYGTGSKFLPEFENGDFISVPYGIDHNIIAKENGESFYDRYPLTLSFNYPVLSKKIHREYGKDAVYEKATEYTYKKGTRLLESETKYANGEETITKYFYPEDCEGAVAAQMVKDNVVGVPVRTTVSRRGVIKNTESVFGKYGERVYKPQYVKEWYENERDTVNSPYYNYDWCGNLISAQDRDGVKSATVYGYDDTLPVFNIAGMRYDELSEGWISNFRKYGADGVEKPDVDLPVTKTLYYPLTGPRKVTTPYGSSQSYEYDSKWRISKIINDGEGTAVDFNYYNPEGQSVVEKNIYVDDSKKHTLTEVLDGLDRKMMSTDGDLTTHYFYDAMGRVCAQANPGADLNDANALTEFFYERSPRGVMTSTRLPGEE